MDRILRFGFILMLIAVISAAILSIVDGKTKPIIEELNRKKQVEARRVVMPQANRFIEEDKFLENGMEFIPAFSGNQMMGYVVSVVSQEGYAGDIVFLLGADLEGKITGVEIVSSQETPGLGAKINEKWWKEQWIGRDIDYRFEKNIDAFAGATVSPEAVYKGIRRALFELENLKQEGVNYDEK